MPPNKQTKPTPRRFIPKKKKAPLSRNALIKQLHRMWLYTPACETASIATLTKLVKDNLKTYLEDIFKKRIRAFLLGEYPAIRPPGHNQSHLYGSKLEFDFSWKSLKLAVEIQGGIDSPHRRTGHLSREGMRRDMRKVCLASIEGWILLQLSPEQIYDSAIWHSDTVALLRRAINVRLQKS